MEEKSKLFFSDDLNEIISVFATTDKNRPKTSKN